MPYGSTIAVSTTFTRPANTTAYTAKDSVSDSATAPTVLSFADITRTDGGSGYITMVQVITDALDITPVLRIHFYSATQTAINDNAAFTPPTYASRADYLGHVDVGPLSSSGAGGDSSYAINDTCHIGFGAASTVFALVETRDAFTPESAQAFYIKIATENN